MFEIMFSLVGWMLQSEPSHIKLTRDGLQPEKADSECRENTLDNITADPLICCVARIKMTEVHIHRMQYVFPWWTNTKN